MNRRWAAAGIVLLILLALAWFVGGTVGSATKPRFPSSFAAEPEGLLALRMLLDQSGVPTAIGGRTWDEMLASEDPGVLLVATPLQRGPDRQEADALRVWIEAGGSLLVLDDATVMEQSHVFAPLLDEIGLAATRPHGEMDPRMLALRRPGTRKARGTPARPSDETWDSITLNAGATLSNRSRAIPLAVGSDGSVLAGETRFGDGRVVRVMGSLLANDRILSGDNLAFGRRLIEDLRDGGNVVFDEYHHGYGGLLSARRLDRGVLGWALAQAFLVALVFALARGVRFGPVRPERRPQRRSSLEFVHSMASLYRRARARRHVVDGAWRRFLREARARWGLAESLPTRKLAESIARLGGQPPHVVSRTLARTRDVLDDDAEITEATMVARVRALARLEKESFR